MTSGDALGLSDIFAMLRAEYMENRYKSGKFCSICKEELWAWKHGDVIELICGKCNFTGSI